MEEIGVSGGRRDLIRQATEALALKEIILYQSRFVRPVAVPEQAEVAAAQQGKTSVRVERLDPLEVNDDTPPLMRCYVHLGTRLVATNDGDEEKEADVYIEIEGEFRVTYEVSNDTISEGALKAFAEFNVIHNVWPFWRQHVFDLVQRGDLPKLEVPLFAGIKL